MKYLFRDDRHHPGAFSGPLHISLLVSLVSGTVIRAKKLNDNRTVTKEESGTGRIIPGSILLGALRAATFRCFPAAAHLDSFAVYQCIGNLTASLVQVAPSGFTRNSEFLGSFFLFEPIEIDEPNQFYLFRLERYPLSLLFRAAAGLVAPGF
jgi:hypothetical protein